MIRNACIIALLLCLSCGDTEQPPIPDITLEFRDITDGTTLSGIAEIMVDVQPEEEVMNVILFRIVGEHSLYLDEDGSPEFTFNLDTPLLDDGPLDITAEAVGWQGQVVTESISLVIDNHPPDIEIVSPEEDEILFIEDLTVPIVIRAWDGSGIETVNLSIDDGTIGAASLTTGDLYQADFDLSTPTPPVLNGTTKLNLTAEAINPAGQSSTAHVSFEIARRTRWQIDPDELKPLPIIGQPALSTDGRAIYVVSEDATFHTLNASTGEVLCCHTFPPGVGQATSGPIASPYSNHVYFGTQFGLVVIGVPEHSICEHQHTEPIAAGEFVVGRPVIMGDKSITVFYTTAQTRDGDDYSTLYAADSGGVSRWSYETTGRVGSGPTLDPDGPRIAFVTDEYVEVLQALSIFELDSGQPPPTEALWRAPTSSPSVGGATVFDGTILFGLENTGFYAYAVADGDIALWDTYFQTDFPIQTRPFIDEQSSIYFANSSEVFGLSNDGAELWRFDGLSGQIGRSSPVVDEDSGLVLFGDNLGRESGTIYALDRETSDLVWFVEKEEQFFEYPGLIVDGTVVFGSSSGRVYAYFLDGQAFERVLLSAR